MPRGVEANVGDVRVSANGYHYTKVEDHPRAQNGWILTHWLTMEKELGRYLEPNEMVKFKTPKDKKDPYNPKGLYVIKKRTTSLRKERARLEANIAEMQARLEAINKELRE